MRVVGSLLLVAALAALGYVAWLNGEDVTLRLAPTRSVTLPMAAALAAAFGSGALLVGLVSLVGGLRRAWRRGRQRRQLRREERRAGATAQAQRLLWAGEYDRARAEILRSDRGLPADVGRIELLAETYLREDDLAAATTLLDGALDTHPADVRLLDLRATVAERQGDIRGAIDALERARRCDDAGARVIRRLRDCYMQSERWADALTLQDELLARIRSPALLGQEQRMTLGLRFEAAVHETDPDRGIRLLESLAKENPTFLPAWVTAGDRHLEAGRPARARKTWERGAYRVPSPVLLDRLEALDAAENVQERTTRRYRGLLKAHPDDRWLPLRFVRHLLAAGATDEALHALEALQPEAPATRAEAALRGELLRQQGDHERAAASLSHALGPGLGLRETWQCRKCGTSTDDWHAACARCLEWATLDAVPAR